jgi:hypothetical protein
MRGSGRGPISTRSDVFEIFKENFDENGKNLVKIFLDHDVTQTEQINI